MSAQTDWFAIARQQQQEHLRAMGITIGVGEPRAGEAGAAPAHDPVPAWAPFRPSPTPTHLTGWRLACLYLGAAVFCFGVWAGIAALVWWIA